MRTAGRMCASTCRCLLSAARHWRSCWRSSCITSKQTAQRQSRRQGKGVWFGTTPLFSWPVRCACRAEPKQYLDGTPEPARWIANRNAEKGPTVFEEGVARGQGAAHRSHAWRCSSPRMLPGSALVGGFAGVRAERVKVRGVSLPRLFSRSLLVLVCRRGVVRNYTPLLATLSSRRLNRSN